MKKSDSNFLRGKEAIFEFLTGSTSQNSQYLDPFISLGLPMIKIGGVHWSHKQEIDDWFRGILRDSYRDRRMAASVSKPKRPRF